MEDNSSSTRTSVGFWIAYILLSFFASTILMPIGDGGLAVVTGWVWCVGTILAVAYRRRLTRPIWAFVWVPTIMIIGLLAVYWLPPLLDWVVRLSKH